MTTLRVMVRDGLWVIPTETRLYKGNPDIIIQVDYTINIKLLRMYHFSTQRARRVIFQPRIDTRYTVYMITRCFCMIE